MNLANFREDTRKQAGGTPIYIGDATFYGKRYGTPACNAKIKEITLALFGPFHKWSEEASNIIHAHLLAEYLIVGWDDVFSEDGEPVPYFKATARQIFLDEEYHLSLNLTLINDLSRFENFLYDAAEEDLAEIIKK